MYSRLFLILTALLISAYPAIAADSDRGVSYTLQVAAFPRTDLADSFVVALVQAGEHPSCATVDLEGRGYWTRVFVGLFPSPETARRYGESLVARGIIKEFLVKRTDLRNAVTRPRRVTLSVAHASSSSAQPAATSDRLDTRRPAHDEHPSSNPSAGEPTASAVGATARPELVQGADALQACDFANISLPVFKTALLELAPSVDTSLVPRPNPVSLAFNLVVGEAACPEAPEEHSGLWITGDLEEALARLRWIVGDENADLIELDGDGQVHLDKKLLANAAGLGSARVDDSLRAARYISSNEGLLLLVQLTQGHHRYCLHIGGQVSTYGRSIEIAGSINLDNNFDSRINPYRKHGKKLDHERPSEGFDSLVALNPVAQWFNLGTKRLVPVGEITFHELAEAQAKVDLGFDYLELGSRPGAHAMALERERRLKSQRPDAGIIMTTGSNRVLRSKEEIRLFFAEAAGGVSQR